jgi:hypothetical protein
MRLEVHSEAREEFLQAVSFYEAQVPGLGLRFITEIERCQNALLETALIGHPYGRRLRKFTVGDKFPYSIVYAVLGIYCTHPDTRRRPERLACQNKCDGQPGDSRLPVG